MSAHSRHDIIDKVQNLLESRLPEREGSWSGVAKDNQRLINDVFWDKP